MNGELESNEHPGETPGSDIGRPLAPPAGTHAVPHVPVPPFAGHRTALAPMEGVGHPLFRALIAENGGLGLLCTEFVRISRAPLNSEHLEGAVVKAPGLPLSVQVMGNEADKMAEAAEVVAGAGADVVDVNLGCPMPRVVRKGVGAAMLKDRALLASVLTAMRKRTPGLLSAKIRAGFDDAKEVVEIARTVEESGVDFIAVHPRRRCDFYGGVADWRIVGVLKDELRIPVIGNGDVWYAADVERMFRETGCDGVMIGRPALRNPWIFEQAAALKAGIAPRDPSGADVAGWLDGVTQRYVSAFGARRSTGRLKELVRWIGRTIHDDGAYRYEALRSPSVDAIMEVTWRHLGALPAEWLDLAPEPRFGFERSGSALASFGESEKPGRPAEFPREPNGPSLPV